MSDRASLRETRIEALRQRCADWRKQEGNDHDESLIVVKTVDVEGLLDVAEAGRALARTWFAVGYWGKPHVPDAIALREALERLGETRV